MLGFIVFDTTHTYTDLNIAKEFLKRVGLPIIETEPIEEIKPIIKKGKKNSNAKQNTPHTFKVTIYDEEARFPIEAELYFNDFRLVLDCQVATHEFDYKWQVFTTYYLKGKTQASYVKSIEQQMIYNLQLTDREFLDEIMANPEKDDELSDRHDDIIKEIIIGFKYLKEIEKDLGFLHEQSYNPFAHPYFNKKEKQPSLVDIVEACNKRKREATEKVLTEQQKESN